MSSGVFYFMKKVQLTKEGFEKIQQELAKLKNTKRQKAIDRLQKARAMGDLSENSEYQAAKEELELVEGRIAELEAILTNIEIVEQKNNSREIQIGSRVAVDVDGERDDFLIVGEFEADPINKKLSQTSPVGQALIGKKIGDQATIDSPSGKIIYKVIDIK